MSRPLCVLVTGIATTFAAIWIRWGFPEVLSFIGVLFMAAGLIWLLVECAEDSNS